MFYLQHEVQIFVNHTENIRVPAALEIRLMTVVIAGSIPVGIVSARQRLDQEKVGHRPTPGDPLSRDHGSMPLPPSGPLVSGISLPGGCLNFKKAVFLIQCF